MKNPTLDQLVEIYQLKCLMCETPYFDGYRGGWCQESCWRLNKVLTREQRRNGMKPDRARLEAVYGPDTPDFVE